MRGKSPSLPTLPPEPVVGAAQPTHSPQSCVNIIQGMLLALGEKKKPQGLEREAARRLHGVLPSPPPVPVVPARHPGHRGSVPRRGLLGGFAIEGLGQPGAGGEGGCDRVFCPTGSYVVGLGVHREGLHSTYLPWEPQLPPCRLLPPTQHSIAALRVRGNRVPMRSRPGRPAAPHRRAAKIMNKLLLINTL